MKLYKIINLRDRSYQFQTASNPAAALKRCDWLYDHVSVVEVVDLARIFQPGDDQPLLPGIKTRGGKNDAP